MLFNICSVVTISFLINGCSIPKPYVHYKNEFNRKSQIYLEGIEDSSTITVCSSNFGKNLKKEIVLAETECKLFGKQAIFSHFSRSKCPLMSLNGLVYNCVIDKKQKYF